MPCHLSFERRMFNGLLLRIPLAIIFQHFNVSLGFAAFTKAAGRLKECLIFNFKWHIGTMARLQHLHTRLAEGRKPRGRTPAVAHFLNQMVAYQAARLTSHGSVARQSKASHHVLTGKLLWQSGE